MHIQLSISPDCPSFLINALLVGVNKHIHSGPKTQSALSLESAKTENAASILYVLPHTVPYALTKTLNLCHHVPIKEPNVI